MTELDEKGKALIRKLIRTDELLTLTRREAAYACYFPQVGLMELHALVESNREATSETYAVLAEWLEIIVETAELAHRKISFLERLAGGEAERLVEPQSADEVSKAPGAETEGEDP